MPGQIVAPVPVRPIAAQQKPYFIIVGDNFEKFNLFTQQFEATGCGKSSLVGAMYGDNFFTDYQPTGEPEKSSGDELPYEFIEIPGGHRLNDALITAEHCHGVIHVLDATALADEARQSGDRLELILPLRILQLTEFMRVSLQDKNKPLLVVLNKCDAVPGFNFTNFVDTIPQQQLLLTAEQFQGFYAISCANRALNAHLRLLHEQCMIYVNSPMRAPTPPVAPLPMQLADAMPHILPRVRRCQTRSRLSPSVSYQRPH